MQPPVSSAFEQPSCATRGCDSRRRHVHEAGKNTAFLGRDRWPEHCTPFGVATPFHEESLTGSLARDCTGAVSIEYVLLLALVGMVVGFAIFHSGPALVQSFAFTRALIISPTP